MHVLLTLLLLHPTLYQGTASNEVIATVHAGMYWQPFYYFHYFLLFYGFLYNMNDIRLIALPPARWVSRGVSWWSSWGQRILSVCLWCCWGCLLAVCLHCRTVGLEFVRVAWWVRAVRRCRGWRFVGYGCTPGGFQPSFIPPWCPLIR